MTRVSNPSMGRGKTSVTIREGVLGQGRPRRRPMTSMGVPDLAMPFWTPEAQCVICSGMGR